MPVDFSQQFGRIGSINDYKRAREEFDLNKKLKQAQIQEAMFKATPEGKNITLPATLQVHNAVKQALDRGDYETANRIMMIHSAQAYGIDTFRPQGGNVNNSASPVSDMPIPTPDKPASISDMPDKPKPYVPTGQSIFSSSNSITNQIANKAATKKKAEIQAQKDVESEMNPEIKYKTDIASSQAAIDAKNIKREVDANNSIPLINQAMKLIPESTAGGIQTLGKETAAFFGNSTESSPVDKKLQILSSKLTQYVPRFEGPQSDYDVQMYKDAAGDLANTEIPVNDRLAAAELMLELENKYANNRNLSETPEFPKLSDIPYEAIKDLKRNPESASQFDEIFGAGSAKWVLGK